LILGGVELDLDIRPLEALLPHEETIPELTTRLAAEIERDGVQRDPVIVDKESLTVLDGMHRLESLRRLGAASVVVDLVDYSSPRVKLFRWIRVFDLRDSGGVKTFERRLGLNFPVTLQEAFRRVDEKKETVAALTNDGALLADVKFGSVLDCYQFLKEGDALAASMGSGVSFVDEEMVDAAVGTPGRIALLTPPLTKSDVVEAAKRKRLLPHKTTLHVVEPRPVGVNYPLDELRKARPSATLLEEGLSKANPSFVVPPETYLGRRYRETLLVIHAQ
jgi:hypothetical protein